MATSNIYPRIFCSKKQVLPRTMRAFNLYSKYDIETCQRRFSWQSSKPNHPHHLAFLSPQIMPFNFWSAFSSTPSEASSKWGRPNSASDSDSGTYRRRMGIGAPLRLASFTMVIYFRTLPYISRARPLPQDFIKNEKKEKNVPNFMWKITLLLISLKLAHSIRIPVN